MSMQLYSLHVLRVDVHKEEWDRVRKRLIGKLPIYGSMPNIYLKISLGKESRKTKPVQNCLSPTWDEQIIFTKAEDAEILSIEIVHNATLRWNNNPRIGHVSVALDELLSNRSTQVEKELLSSQNSSMMGRIYLRLISITAGGTLEGAKGDVARLKNFQCISSTTEATQSVINTVEQSGLYQAVKGFVETLGPVVNLLDKVSKVHPFLEISWQSASSLLSVISEQFKTDSKVIDLVDEMSRTFKYVVDIDVISAKNASLEEAIVALTCQITECCLFVKEYTGNGFLRRLITLRDREKVDMFKNLFEATKNYFHAMVNIDINTKVSKLEFVSSQTHRNTVPLNVHAQLQPEIPGGTPHSTCLPGTRLEYTQKIIEKLLLDTSEQKIVWLNGPAGTGKSTIALTIAERLASLSRLGAYIFFTRYKSQPNLVIQTIADKLAFFDATIAEHILKAMPSCAGLSPEFQVKQLLLSPLKEASVGFHGPIVIILDALDECGDYGSRKELMELLSSGVFLDLPKNIRFLITSRPERDIIYSFSIHMEAILEIRLDPTDETSQKDVAFYLSHELPSSVKRKTNGKVLENWPSVGDLETVTTASSGLFIWASTLIKLVANDPLPTQRFSEIVNRIRSSPNLEFKLDDMYKIVLVISKIFERYKDLSCKLLNVILLTRKPISGKAIVELLRLRPEEVELLSELQSVLFYSEEEPIYFFHASFPDYLTSRERSREFFIDTTRYKPYIAECCLDVMLGSRGLEVNICKLVSPLVKYQEIPGIENFISEQLECASTLWSCGCDKDIKPLPRPQFVKKIRKFLEEYLLPWFEVLSLTKSFHHSGLCLLGVIMWAKDNAKSQVPILREARRLASKYFTPISQSAPHIYLSMLPLEKNSLISDMYKQLVSPIVKVEMKGAKPPSILVNTLEGHSSYVNWVLFSPDGQYVISSSENNEVIVWEAESGELFHSFSVNMPRSHRISFLTFSSYTKKLVIATRNHVGVWDANTWKVLIQMTLIDCGNIKAIAFSETQEDEIIVSSEDGSVTTWDARNEAFSLKEKFEFETDLEVGNFQIWDESWDDVCYARIVSFSPISRRIVFGYSSGLISIWNWEDNTHVLLDGHEESITLLKFSQSSLLLASSSLDGEIKVWDIENGSLIQKINYASEASVISFSSVGELDLLASGHLDGSIVLWDIQTGKKIMGPYTGHCERVTSISFSPDGSRFASGSQDNLIKIWDSENREVGRQEVAKDYRRADFVLFDKDENIISIWKGNCIRKWDRYYQSEESKEVDYYSNYISPDGSRAISKSCGIWNTTTDKHCFQMPSSRPPPICFAASYNASLVFSGNNDGEINIWEAEDGESYSRKRIYRLQLEGVLSRLIATSNGLRFATLENLNVVRVWNAFDGKQLFRYSGDMLGDMLNLTFSSNGSLIALASSEKSVLIYDVWSGCLVKSLQGHTSTIVSVIFSPDNNYMGSGSVDGSVIVWSVGNGEMLFSTFVGHTGPVVSVSFPAKNHYIASASEDGSIRIWDLRLELMGLKIQKDDSIVCNSIDTRVLDIWQREFLEKVKKFTRWKIGADGWVYDDESQLLLWVPEELRPNLLQYRNTSLLGPQFSVELVFVNSNKSM